MLLQANAQPDLTNSSLARSLRTCLCIVGDYLRDVKEWTLSFLSRKQKG